MLRLVRGLALLMAVLIVLSLAEEVMQLLLWPPERVEDIRRGLAAIGFSGFGYWWRKETEED